MTALPKSRQRKLLLAFFLLLGLLGSLSLSYWYLMSQGTAKITAQSEKQLSELMTYWDNALKRFERIPKVLSSNPMLMKALEESKNKQTIRTINQYLQEMQLATNAADIYLINAKGITVAASNWDKSTSFINQDYSFRPYFIQARQGDQGRYFAVGTASDIRGYYFSSPVTVQGDVIGVIVVKMDISAIEIQSKGIAKASSVEFMISDPDDIVFLSSVDSWRFNALTPLTQARRYAINASKRYATRPIAELSLKPAYQAAHSSSIYSINSGDGRQDYLNMSQVMSQAQWRIHILAPMAPLYKSLPASLLLAATLYLLLTLAVIYTFERRRYYQQMQKAQDQLEQRVKLRTAELEHSNHKLKRTQEELIQAAKLTVIGSLSASINHELNQPLAALRSYAQNTQTFIARNMIDKANENIQIMIELTDRLADIIGQFKSFTRKSSGQDNATEISTTVEQALIIVKPELEKRKVKLTTSVPQGHCQIWGDGLRLQQVLVNLMSNAIVAMEQSRVKELTISVKGDKKITISIQDTGPGVVESQLDKIFEPYFTTSERQGLGLGLSISERIVESMQGSITVENASQGGAIFTITLPAYLVENK
jgi:two-component system C4-dicarboxylate transport sensor histidine kinase DctB